MSDTIPSFNYLESYSVGELKKVLDDDTLSIWLDRNSGKHQYQQNSPSPYNFRAFLDKKAKMMKKLALNYYQEMFPNEVHTLSPPSQPNEKQVQEQILLTQRAMSMKKGIIVNPTLFDPATKIYGTVDLIARFSLLEQCYDLRDLTSFLRSSIPSDAYVMIIAKFWCIKPTNNRATRHCLKIEEKDRKKKLLHLLPLQNNLNPTHRIPHFVFVLPREPISLHTSSNKGIYSFCLFSHEDREKIEKTTTWMHRSIPELLKREIGSSYFLTPNMKDNKNRWSDAKTEIAKKFGELTLLPWITCERRNILWEHKITSISELSEYYNDNRSFPFGLKLDNKSSKRSISRKKQLSLLLSCYSQPEPQYYAFNPRIGKIPWNQQASLEFFVHFETINNQNDDFAEFPQVGGFPMIFMIGCSEYINGKLKFFCFTADDESSFSEKKVIDSFYDHIKNRTNNFTDDYRLYHWTHHERTKMKKAIERHREQRWRTLFWCDLSKPFDLDKFSAFSKIYIKNLFGYVFRDVGKTLHSFKKIKTTWPPNSHISDYLEAQVAACVAYNLKKEGRIKDILESEAMKEVYEHNRIDCNILAEILTWMRSLLL